MRVGTGQASVLLIAGASCKAARLVLHPLGDHSRVQSQSWKRLTLSERKGFSPSDPTDVSTQTLWGWRRGTPGHRDWVRHPQRSLILEEEGELCQRSPEDPFGLQ